VREEYLVRNDRASHYCQGDAFRLISISLARFVAHTANIAGEPAYRNHPTTTTRLAKIPP